MKIENQTGSNGKTTLMRAVERVAGNFLVYTERDFLYETGFANPNGASANLLSYVGKLIAYFDEPSCGSGPGAKRLDVRRIKDLVSGDSRIRGRNLQSSNIIEFV